MQNTVFVVHLASADLLIVLALQDKGDNTCHHR